MTIPIEFSFLSADAARVGRTRPLPRVSRLAVTAGSGRNVSALRFGEDAPRMVMLHGAGLNAHTFDPTLLAADMPAVSIDLPGHGRSDWRDDADYSPSAMAEDVADTVHALTSGPVHLVGQSLGGLTCAALTGLLGDRVLTVTLIDITPGVQPSSDAESIREFMQGQRTFHTVDEMVQRAIDFGIGTDRVALTRGVTLNTRVRHDGLIEWTHHFAHLDGMGASASSASISEEGPYAHLWEPLHALGDRVTLLRGTDGIVDAERLAEWGERLSEAPHHTLEGGHNLQEHAPVALAQSLHHIATTSS